MKTVGELREALKQYGDDTPLLVEFAFDSDANFADVSSVRPTRTGENTVAAVLVVDF